MRWRSGSDDAKRGRNGTIWMLVCELMRDKEYLRFGLIRDFRREQWKT